MNSRQSRTSLVSPLPPVLTSKEIVLPADIILYMAKFLCFADFRSFIRSLWPNNDEDDIIREKLWQLSTNSITTIFINGKQLKVIYNFDSSRTEENRNLVSVNSLLPLFGGIVLPAMDSFTSVSKLCSFVKMHVHLNMCSAYQHASCPCHLANSDEQCGEKFVRPSVDTCDYGHFHHYCFQHLIHWLDIVLSTSIVLRETGKKYVNEDGSENFVVILPHGSSAMYGKAILPCALSKEL
ncbi:f3.2 [Tranosema rostrale ichnovirus]|nr:f3.2 [Tranosema rostrale ichnovirus]